MSKTTDALKAIGCTSGHALTRKGHPVVKYHKKDGDTPAYWHVGVKGSDKDAKFYCGRGATKAVMLEEAMEHVAANFADLEMVPNPFNPKGSFVVKADLDAALEAAK